MDSSRNAVAPLESNAAIARGSAAFGPASRGGGHGASRLASLGRYHDPRPDLRRVRGRPDRLGLRYDEDMDVLRRDDLEVARRTSPGERARQALELMEVGFRLKRAALRARHPTESGDQLEARFRTWLEGDDRA